MEQLKQEDNNSPNDNDNEDANLQETPPHNSMFRKDQEQELKVEGSIEKMTKSKLMYEADEEDLELRQKLMESKVARKKTEEDTKVLMNRLQLLKNEEQKAWKKIEETKKKALEIMKTKQRNAEILRKKQEVTY